MDKFITESNDSYHLFESYIFNNKSILITFFFIVWNNGRFQIFFVLKQMEDLPENFHKIKSNMALSLARPKLIDAFIVRRGTHKVS